MRQQSLQIIHKVSHPMRNSSGRKQKHPLLILLFLRHGPIDGWTVVHFISLTFSLPLGLCFRGVHLLRFQDGGHVVGD